MDLIKVAVPCVGQEEVKAVSKVLLSGQYVSGKHVSEFENAFAAYNGSKYAVAVNSGTAAIQLALDALGIGPGDEVIVPPLTFFSTVSAVLLQRAVPVFADIDVGSYCLSPASFEASITERTKAVMPVHLFGNSAEMGKIKQIALKYKIKVIEDAAQAHGTEYRGKKVGSIGDIGCFSFFATKHMTTGEGGILLTNNKRYADMARRLRSHGMTDRHTHAQLGYNFRMTEMAAVLGSVQLQKLEGFNAQRIKNSQFLINKFSELDLPWLILPALKKHIKHTFFWCPIRIDEMKLGKSTQDLIRILREQGIETRNRYLSPLYSQPALSKESVFSILPYMTHKYWETLNYNNMNLNNVEQIAGHVIGLPNHIGLSKLQLNHIVDVISRIR